MNNLKLKYMMSLLLVLLLIPVMNFNLYSDDDGDSNVKVTGTITAITLFSITVDSTEFAVNSDTKIEAEGDISFDLLKVGDSVKVEGELIDSVLTATEIKLLTNDDGDEEEVSEFSISGFISELSDSSLTVNGQIIMLTDSTEIDFDDEDSSSVSELAVGLEVEVEGIIIDSVYFAQKIEIKGEVQDSTQEFEITGTILTIGSDNFTIDTLTIYVDSNTVIEKENVGSISFSELIAGDSVEVKGVIDSGTYLAQKIEVISIDTVLVEVEEEGEITDVSDSTVTVNDKTFELTADTRITKEDSTVDKSYLIVGVTVKIKGFMTDSTLVATEIEIKDDNNDTITEFELKGPIEAINIDTLTVDGTMFVVDSNTVIKMEETGLIGLSDLVVGMEVEVHGTIVNDVKIASKIEVKSTMSEEAEIQGEITAVLDSTFTVNNTVFTVTSETMIFAQDSVISFADLAAGNFVKVKYSIVDSINYALMIKVKENTNHNDSEEVSDIDMVSSNNFSANNRNFAVDDETQVYNKYGSRISYTELKSGLKVYIYEDIKNGQLYAGRIDVLSEITSDVASDMNSMVELVNEPNPFSDASTLKLTVPNDGNISCALYNETGEQVFDVYSGFVNKGENYFIINRNSNLVSGTYYINLVYNGRQYVRAVIKLK